MPAVFTAAIFAALFVLDLITKNYKDIGFHVAGGIFSVLGIYTACEVAGEVVAWILLSIPFVFLIIGLGLIWADSQKDPKPVEQPAENLPCCQYCSACPCRCRRRRCPTPPSGPGSGNVDSYTPPRSDTPAYVSPPSPFSCKA